MLLAAVVVAEAIKESSKERETQATLRTLLEKDVKNAAEVLAYLRERDAAAAAENARFYAILGRIWRDCPLLQWVFWPS